MNTFNHLDIARIVQKSMEDEFLIEIDTAAFIYGNIKPDISPDLIKIPHYIEDGLGFVESQIEVLLYYRLNTISKCTKDFSERLGVIMHYLSDFFCHAHSAHYKGGNLSHMVYEFNLHNYFRNHSKLIEAQYNSMFLNPDGDYKSICTFIYEQNLEYLKKSPSYENDMKFTLGICNTVCRTVILACLSANMAISG